MTGLCQTANCRQATDCSAGQVCKNNVCSNCQTDNDCSRGSLCLSGACKAGNCRISSDCAGGLVCLSNQCSACSDDKQCGSGQLCLSGVCKAGNCRVNKDCTNGTICKQNQCVACSVKADCGTGEICVQGKCVQGECSQNSECSSKICDLQTYKCKAATCNDNVKNGQETDIDCGGSTCGVCKKGKACQTNADCSSGRCNTSSKTCEGEYLHCKDAYSQGVRKSGVYLIDPDGTGTAIQPFKAYCDMTEQGGGWTLVEVRKKGSTSTLVNDVVSPSVTGKAVTDPVWQTLTKVGTQIMVKDGNNKVGALLNVAKLKVSSCVKLSSTLRASQLAHSETSGCSVTGVDYCLFGSRSVSSNTAVYNECSSARTFFDKTFVPPMLPYPSGPYWNPAVLQIFIR